MKCPSCKYQHGWDGEMSMNIVGSKGDFFVLALEMRRHKFMDEDTERLYACPHCGIAFIVSKNDMR